MLSHFLWVRVVMPLQVFEIDTEKCFNITDITAVFYLISLVFPSFVRHMLT